MIPAAVTELFNTTGRPAGVAVKIGCLIFASFFFSRCFHSIHVHSLTPLLTAILLHSLAYICYLQINNEKKVRNQATYPLFVLVTQTHPEQLAGYIKLYDHDTSTDVQSVYRKCFDKKCLIFGLYKSFSSVLQKNLDVGIWRQKLNNVLRSWA